MKALIIDTSFPAIPADEEDWRKYLGSTDTLDEDASQGAKMCYVLHLIRHKRNADAGLLIDTINFAPTDSDMPLIYRAWLWLARMCIYIPKKDFTMAADSAEHSLLALDAIAVKRGEDFLAILAGILYNLALMHNATGENVRAAKELSKAQKLYERLMKKNESRFASMLTYAVEASTLIFSSRTEQMKVFSQYQELSEKYSSLASAGNHDAIVSLMDALTKEGDIMMQMGNSRDAMKYYTRALRCHKRLNEPMTKDTLRLSIALARAMMRKQERRDKAVQLLTSLQPIAQQLAEKEAISEIEKLLNGPDKNFSIMSLLKGIF